MEKPRKNKIPRADTFWGGAGKAVLFKILIPCNFATHLKPFSSHEKHIRNKLVCPLIFGVKLSNSYRTFHKISVMTDLRVPQGFLEA